MLARGGAVAPCRALGRAAHERRDGREHLHEPKHGRERVRREVSVGPALRVEHAQSGAEPGLLYEPARGGARRVEHEQEAVGGQLAHAAVRARLGRVCVTAQRGGAVDNRARGVRACQQHVGRERVRHLVPVQAVEQVQLVEAQARGGGGGRGRGRGDAGAERRRVALPSGRLELQRSRGERGEAAVDDVLRGGRGCGHSGGRPRNVARRDKLGRGRTRQRRRGSRRGLLRNALARRARGGRALSAR